MLAWRQQQQMGGRGQRGLRRVRDGDDVGAALAREARQANGVLRIPRQRDRDQDVAAPAAREASRRFFCAAFSGDGPHAQQIGRQRVRGVAGEIAARAESQQQHLARLEQASRGALNLRLGDRAPQRFSVDDGRRPFPSARPSPCLRLHQLAQRRDRRLQLVAEHGLEIGEALEARCAGEAVDRRDRGAGQRSDLLRAVRQGPDRMRRHPASHPRERRRGLGDRAFDAVLGQHLNDLIQSCMIELFHSYA